jgi:hypothetical protein
MTRHDTHLCLVSAHATPNLLPVPDEAWCPCRVGLAATPDNPATQAASPLKSPYAPARPAPGPARR